AAYNGQGQIAFEAQLSAVAATLQAVSGLQCSNRRFHAGMTLACLAEFGRCRCLLSARLLRAFLRQAYVRNDLSQLLLVLGRVEATIEGDLFHAAPETFLQRTCLLDGHVLIQCVARQNVEMRDETSRV